MGTPHLLAIWTFVYYLINLSRAIYTKSDENGDINVKYWAKEETK
jgi:hypothetical protein